MSSHHEHVLVLDRLIEVLEEADGLGAGLLVLLGVGADGQEVDLEREVDGPARSATKKREPLRMETSRISWPW